MSTADDDVIEQQLKEPPEGSVALRCFNKSTKLRIVYDISAKVNGCSVNECLYKGHCLTPLIFDSLLKFRWYNTAITADIEKAFCRFLFSSSRFLLFEDIAAVNPEVIKFRIRRVLFGASCSQYLLNTVVHVHIDHYEKIEPDFVKKLKYKLYVDDLAGGTNDVVERVEFYEKASRDSLKDSLI